MKKPIILITLTSLLVLLLSGCANVNTVSRSNEYATKNVVNDKRVITDTGLGKKITITEVVEGVVSGDLTKVQVRLQNNRSYELSINYAFEWYDLNGMQVDSTASGWKSLRLQGKEEKAVSSIAPNPNAMDFVLKLQEPN